MIESLWAKVHQKAAAASAALSNHPGQIFVSPLILFFSFPTIEITFPFSDIYDFFTLQPYGGSFLKSEFIYVRGECMCMKRGMRIDVIGLANNGDGQMGCICQNSSLELMPPRSLLNSLLSISRTLQFPSTGKGISIYIGFFLLFWKTVKFKESNFDSCLDCSSLPALHEASLQGMGNSLAGMT